MHVVLTDRQRTEVEQIKADVSRLAERLRGIHQHDDTPQDDPLWQASSLLEAARTKIAGYFDPSHAGDIDWQRKR